MGLYLDPPDGAIVLSVDEKTQIQALDRTQPMLTLRPGQAERHTHDYKRHGTTCLFAALQVGSGAVTTDHRARHTGRLPGFHALGGPRLSRGRAARRARQRLHPHDARGTGLARATSRITFHFTPTSASWMNQIETWFGILTRKAIRRGRFGSVTELIAMVDAFTRSWNEGARPFVWVKTADAILAKAVPKPPANSGSGH